MQEAMSFERAATLAVSLRKSISEAVFGQTALIDEAVSCLFAGGHVLMTGAPGLAKTTLVKVIAQNLGLEFGRVQFTPDLLPADVTGSDILNIDPASGRRNFEFSKGPIFTNLLLADEINRASPRTQSALLEAMQERAVTYGGKRYPLPPPFMVFATQNPFESEGTFPLPEAQLDRFLLHSMVEYPDSESEYKILQEHSHNRLAGEQRDWVKPENTIISNSAFASIAHRVSELPIDQELVRVIRDLVRSTRPEDELCPQELHPAIWYGAGPRAGIALISAARAFSLLSGQEVVRWQTIRRLAKPVLRHRIRLTAQAIHDGFKEDRVIDMLLERLESKYLNVTRGLV